MPYIKKRERDKITKGLTLALEDIDTKGELCFAIYYLMKEFAEMEMNFDNASNAIAAADCAKLEFYRRILAPYEDQKIQENGDIE
jgi:hypothetical protein